MLCNSLKINEIFDSIQFEGGFCGTPATFIRLQGCSVGCSFCDTKKTWNSQDGNLFAVQEICRQVNCNHVVITGGEPFEQDIFELCELLLSFGKTVQIETSGTVECDVPDDVFVTLSPKHKYKKLIPQALERANEFKIVLGKEQDVNDVDVFKRHGSALWFQPMSRTKKGLDLCIKAAKIHDGRISIQTHTYLGLD